MLASVLLFYDAESAVMFYVSEATRKLVNRKRKVITDLQIIKQLLEFSSVEFVA